MSRRSLGANNPLNRILVLFAYLLALPQAVHFFDELGFGEAVYAVGIVGGVAALHVVVCLRDFEVGEQRHQGFQKLQADQAKVQGGKVYQIFIVVHFARLGVVRQRQVAHLLAFLACRKEVVQPLEKLLVALLDELLRVLKTGRARSVVGSQAFLVAYRDRSLMVFESYLVVR